MAHIPPPAEELRFLDHQLRQLEAHRSVLLARRAWLISILGTTGRPPAQGSPAQTAHHTPDMADTGAPVPRPARSEPMVAAARMASTHTHPPDLPPPAYPHPVQLPSSTAAERVDRRAGGPGRPDTSPPKVQNVLLVLGGVLLAVAALAFTVVSWGQLGIAARSLVLGALTVAALVAVVPLLARGLRSTAEAVAGLALALTVLDAYALHRTALAHTDGVGYAAAASAVLAAGWAAYGYAFPALRVPPAAAAAVAQLPLLLWAAAANAGPRTVTALLLVTAGADAALALWLRAPRQRWQRGWTVRLVAVVGGCVAGDCGLPYAGWLSWRADTVYDALRTGALLALGAAALLVAAWRLPRRDLSWAAALVGGLAAVAAVGGVLRALLPDAWTVPGYLMCSVAVLVLAGALPDGLPGAGRRGLSAAGLAAQGLCVLWALPVAVTALVGPAGWVDDAWTGAPADARAAVTADLYTSSGAWLVPHPAMASLVLGVAAGALAWVARAPRDSGIVRRSAAACWALGLACGGVLALPVAFALPYDVALVFSVLLTAALLAVATGTHPYVLGALGVPAPAVTTGEDRTARPSPPLGTPSPPPRPSWPCWSRPVRPVWRWSPKRPRSSYSPC